MKIDLSIVDWAALRKTKPKHYYRRGGKHFYSDGRIIIKKCKE